jgi:monoamine oxidase
MAARNHIIIVGVGASALMAARELKNKFHVIMVEAAGRVGGRIQTLHDPAFSQPVERSVEFIHGDLPLTMEIIHNSKISYKAVSGKMYRSENGDWKQQDEFAVGWKKLMQRMNELKEDVTVEDFLNKNFAGAEHGELRKSVCRFAEGFDLADTKIASVLALREEWMEEEDEQFRIPGGYDQFVKSLEDECRNGGVEIYLNAPVKKIEWKKNLVKIITADGKIFEGNKAIVTVPVTMLQAQQDFSISFEPSIDSYFEAAKKIGFGSVVKVMIEFSEPFWLKEKHDLGFVFSPQLIPTWWTQSKESCLLTGWAGGPQARKTEVKPDEEILANAIESLAGIFQPGRQQIEKLMRAFHVANWRNDPFTKGAYSYNTIETREAKEFLAEPVFDTIYFGGEAVYTGSSPGTVEAALTTGKNIANKILEE